MSLSEPTLQRIARFQHGDQVAFGELYEEFGPQVRQYLWMMLGDAEAADDLLQDVMMAAWRDRGQLRAAPAFVSWMLGIARHAGLAEFRRRRRAPFPLDQPIGGDEEDMFPSVQEMPGDGPMPHADMEHAKRAAILEQVIQVLRPKEREIIMMTYYMDLKQREIADALGVPLGSVGTTLRRALEKMQQELERKGLKIDTLL